MSRKVTLCWIILLSSLSRISLALPQPSQLKKIYNIKNARGIEFIKEFPEYEDNVGYGNRPNCLYESHLRILNTTLDWNNPLSYQIRNYKKLYVAKINNAYISPAHLGTIFDNE